MKEGCGLRVTGYGLLMPADCDCCLKTKIDNNKKILIGQNKIPVTIITGFLGSGKTTFINHLLQNYSETQFALVENEFGDVAIDTKLIKGVDASQMFELKQGCICCTITDEYELVLQELAERFSNVEHLIIETTGVADAASVIRPFFVDEVLKEIYEYNGTVCLLDALNVENQTEKEITLKQIVVADLILISKTEWIENVQKETLKQTLYKLNPLANIGFTGNRIELNSILQKKKTEFDFMTYQSGHSHIQTRLFSTDKSLDKTKFVRWLAYTLDIYKNKIYRTKGILCFENEPYEYVLQGVGGSYEITEGELNLGETRSEVVFIGKLGNVDLDYR